jgi:hypothetical protein
MSFFDLVTATDRAVKGHLGGVPVLYAPAAGAVVEVTGIFHEDYQLVEEGENGVSSLGPAVFLELADLPVDPRQDTPALTIAGFDYTVHEVRPAGMVSVLLLLHVVP